MSGRGVIGDRLTRPSVLSLARVCRAPGSVRRADGGQGRDGLSAHGRCAAFTTGQRSRGQPSARRPGARPGRMRLRVARSAPAAAASPARSAPTPTWCAMAVRTVGRARRRADRPSRSGPAGPHVRGSTARRCAGHVLVRPEHRRFEEGVGGQTIGPVHAGGGAFAGRRTGLEGLARPSASVATPPMRIVAAEPSGMGRMRGRSPPAMQAANTAGNSLENAGRRPRLASRKARPCRRRSRSWSRRGRQCLAGARSPIGWRPDIRGCAGVRRSA